MPFLIVRNSARIVAAVLEGAGVQGGPLVVADATAAVAIGAEAVERPLAGLNRRGVARQRVHDRVGLRRLLLRSPGKRDAEGGDGREHERG